MALTVDIEQLAAQPTAVVRGRLRPEEMGSFVGPAFGEVLEVLGASGLHPVGPPFCRYQMHEDAFDVEAGFPVSGPVIPAGRVEAALLPAGQVATTMHVGAYDAVGAVYDALMRWLDEHALVVTGDPWESYLDGPEVPEPRTVVRVPCGDAPTEA